MVCVSMKNKTVPMPGRGCEGWCEDITDGSVTLDSVEQELGRDLFGVPQ